MLAFLPVSVIPKPNYDVPATVAEIALLAQYGWEISEDQTEARLYSEGWSLIQAAVWSTRCWIEDNQ